MSQKKLVRIDQEVLNRLKEYCVAEFSSWDGMLGNIVTKAVMVWLDEQEKKNEVSA